MSTQITNADIDEKQVADYLLRHSDFFVDRQKLLLSLNLPHEHSGTISLVERQVSLLRERVLEAKKKEKGFIQAATANDEIFLKCQKLFLALLETDDPEIFFSSLEQCFRQDFQCNAYNLIVFDEQAEQISDFAYLSSEIAARKAVANLMKTKNPTLGKLRPEEQAFLFQQQSEKVQSAAVLPIRQGNNYIGLLAIGSSEPSYFHAGMGTLFISFIADALARMLPKYLKPC